MEADKIDDKMKDSRPYQVKKLIDKLLPLALTFLLIYLYLELLTPSENFFYSYKALIQYGLLIYFVVDLLALFSLYEENTVFIRNHWFDILLTVPFVTAFKGLKGLKFLKPVKSMRIWKSLKLGKTAKISQKTGKLVKKGRKQLRKLFD